MPNWSEILSEIEQVYNQNQSSNPFDIVRRKYLKLLYEHTGRNTIAYYSGFLQKPGSDAVSVNDKDKSGFMLTVNKLDKTKGLDLILHTPGGDAAATESLVDYLYSLFGKDIRVVVPQIAMSAGTMIALSSKEIVMGKHSNLGPIDPQLGGVPCHGVVDEFNRALSDVQSNPSTAAIWQVIISKYHPTFLGSCQHAIDWSSKMVCDWLIFNMCGGDRQKAEFIVGKFSSHKENKTHSRHISKNECKDIGLVITDLESDQIMQDLVLTVHHVFMHTFANSSAVKIIENHLGIAYIENLLASQS